MTPGTRGKFSAPMFETEVFRKQMYCIEESTCDIVRTFRRPRPGNCAHLVTPIDSKQDRAKVTQSLFRSQNSILIQHCWGASVRAEVIGRRKLPMAFHHRGYLYVSASAFRSSRAVAHTCYPNKFLFLAIFLKKNNKEIVSWTKNSFTFVSKTLSFRKCFLNKNIFVLKQFIFVSETLRETSKKNRISFVVDDEMDVDVAHLTWGNLARWKRWKHCSFLQQGSGPNLTPILKA